MIKKKANIDCSNTFKKSCENNDIILSTKNTNDSISYIDQSGNKRLICTKKQTKRSETNSYKKSVFIAVGDTVKIYTKSEEGIQTFEGIVLRKQGVGADKIITVRNSDNGVVTEKTLLVHSPIIAKVEVVHKSNSRPSGYRKLKIDYQKKKTEEMKKRINKRTYV